MDFSRWKYRFVSWFFDKPDACFEMAKKLGVPTWAKRVRM